MRRSVHFIAALYLSAVSTVAFGADAAPVKVLATIDRAYNRVHNSYMRLLHESLRTVSVTLVFAGIILVSIYFLYSTANNELAPEEDQSFFIASATFATGTAPSSAKALSAATTM